jgi:glycosyltransferase A (GT-A) superfamily protein (DUF2064 family)
MTDPPVLLIVAKAPVPGLAKTRLAAAVGASAAADLAAACLLDTLDAARATGWPVVVALTGHLGVSARRDAVCDALLGCLVVPQRGPTFAARLAAAHADAASACPDAAGVLQIGMDTPQAGATQLEAAHRLMSAHGSVLGPAPDGGWWLLGLADAAAADCLADVPMSRRDTCTSTMRALRGRGLTPAFTDALDDVDWASDAEKVARTHPRLRFAAAWRATLVPTS